MGKKKGGKQPQGRARMKEKAQKSGGSPWGKQGYSDWSEDEGTTGFRGFGGSTTRSFAAKDPNTKLRHKGIAFISAGSNTPAEETEVDEGLIAAIELNDDDDDDEESEEMDIIPQIDGAMEVDEVVEELVEEKIVEEEVRFIVDTKGDDAAPAPKTSTAAIDKILNRASSPAPSDSDDEVILFHGRKKIVTLDDPFAHREAKQPAPPPPAPAPRGPIIIDTVPAPQQGFTPVPDGTFWREGGPSNVTQYQKQFDATKEEGTTQEETIEMLQAAWKQAKKEKELNKRQQRESEDNTPNRRGKRGRKARNKQFRDLGDSDPDIAAYEDYLQNLKDNESEPEVTDEIEDVADAVMGSDEDWEDTSDEDEELDSAELTDSDSSELDEELAQAEREFHEAEDALHMSRQQSKSDAAIARLWQKQLELGITADELVIDDGDDDYDGVGDVEAARAGYEDFIRLSNFRPKKNKKRGGREPVFADASALADSIDQYGNEGFDIMDFDRPSLRSTKKGRKGKLPPELEALTDDELRENMRSAWDNDRAKKRAKKAEREELRTMGLLGSKNGKLNLAQKYQQGLNSTQVYHELAVFLQDDGKNCQAFPPMDKTDRKTLHQVASHLGLKSKSVGSGNNRAPVLTKTRYTREYDEAEFKRVTSFSRGWFLTNNKTGRGSKKTAVVKRGGGASMAAASVRHGEVVGAGAKEIGKESFGHRLMEKMGWSKGMALGKDGEGVLQPVEQMMRVGRAGLG